MSGAQCRTLATKGTDICTFTFECNPGIYLPNRDMFGAEHGMARFHRRAGTNALRTATGLHVPAAHLK